MIINCFRYLGFTSLHDIEVLTLFEYQMMMRAYSLKRVDKEYDMHLQAWLNHGVTATKEQGKKQVSVYKDFKEFFDYEKRLKEVEGRKPKVITAKQRNMARIAARVNTLKVV